MSRKRRSSKRHNWRNGGEQRSQLIPGRKGISWIYMPPPRPNYFDGSSPYGISGSSGTIPFDGKPIGEQRLGEQRFNDVDPYGEENW